MKYNRIYNCFYFSCKWKIKKNRCPMYLDEIHYIDKRWPEYDTE